jgi:hypothetical protein
MKQAFVAATAFLVFQVFTSAGVRVTMETDDGKKPPEVAGWLLIGDENRLRIDSEVDDSTGEADFSLIFQADSEEMYMVDHDEREYMRIDKATIQGLSVKLDEAMRQMEEQLKNMPEAQRKIMEDMLKQNMPQSGGQFEVSVNSLGPDGDLEKYEVMIGGEKRTEVWVAPAGQRGVEPEHLEVFRKMTEFYEELMSSFANSPLMQSAAANPFPGFIQMNGFPVKVYDLEEDRTTYVSEAVDEDFPAGFFGPPEGYQERKPMDQM